MTKRIAFIATLALVALLMPNLALAQAADAETNVFDIYYAIAIAAGFGIAIAAAACGIAQSRAIAAGLEGIARNPSAAGAIRGQLILGLVLIESLAIYALLIALLLIFLLKPALP